MFGRESNIQHSEPSLDGFYFAKVVQNADPLALERVRVRILGVHDWDNEDEENSVWAIHVSSSKNSSGEIPDPGDWLVVSFMRPGNPSSLLLWWGWAKCQM